MEGVQPLTVHWLSPACLQVTFLPAQEGTLSGLACSLSNQTSIQEWTPGLLTLQQPHPQLYENSLGESHSLSVVTLWPSSHSALPSIECVCWGWRLGCESPKAASPSLRGTSCLFVPTGPSDQLQGKRKKNLHSFVVLSHVKFTYF